MGFQQQRTGRRCYSDLLWSLFLENHKSSITNAFKLL
jgi:hypothetical protein